MERMPANMSVLALASSRISDSEHRWMLSTMESSKALRS